MRPRLEIQKGYVQHSILCPFPFALKNELARVSLLTFFFLKLAIVPLCRVWKCLPNSVSVHADLRLAACVWSWCFGSVTLWPPALTCGSQCNGNSKQMVYIFLMLSPVPVQTASGLLLKVTGRCYLYSPCSEIFPVFDARGPRKDRCRIPLVTTGCLETGAEWLCSDSQPLQQWQDLCGSLLSIIG